MSSLTIAEDKPQMLAHHAAQWNGVRLGHWRVLPGELPEITHPDHEISIPISGSLTTIKHTSGGGCRPSHGNAGTVCIVPAGQPIAAQWHEELEVVTLFLKPWLVARAASGENPQARVELVETYEAADHLIRQIGLALLAEAVASDPVGRLYAESLAQTLALHLVRRYSVACRTRDVFRGGLSGNNLRRATEFINEHLEQDLTLADIADSVGLSQYHFARAFKRTTGCTPQQYLTERRVARAKRLLAEGELPLVEISARAGFKNQSHFTTLFRRFTAMTPKVWRENKVV